MMNELFVEDAANAVEKFSVLSLRTNSPARFGVAEAGTGSRYEMYAMQTAEGSWLMVVRQPWIGVYEVQEMSYLTPDYFVEKWGKPGRRLSEHHGGDVYALMTLGAMLVRYSFPAPGDLL
jgi:hypothetical protein